MAKLYDTTCYISGKRAGKGSPERTQLHP